MKLIATKVRSTLAKNLNTMYVANSYQTKNNRKLPFFDIIQNQRKCTQSWFKYQPLKITHIHCITTIPCNLITPKHLFPLSFTFEIPFLYSHYHNNSHLYNTNTTARPPFNKSIVIARRQIQEINISLQLCRKLLHSTRLSNQY